MNSKQNRKKGLRARSFVALALFIAIGFTASTHTPVAAAALDTCGLASYAPSDVVTELCSLTDTEVDMVAAVTENVAPCALLASYVPSDALRGICPLTVEVNTEPAPATVDLATCEIASFAPSDVVNSLCFNAKTN